MAFDLKTAKPQKSGGFDLATARVATQEEPQRIERPGTARVERAQAIRRGEITPEPSRLAQFGAQLMAPGAKALEFATEEPSGGGLKEAAQTALQQLPGVQAMKLARKVQPAQEEIRQSVVGAIAQPALEAIRGEREPRALLGAAGRGLMQKTRAEVSDIPRELGAPEPVAEALGFGAEVAGSALLGAAGAKLKSGLTKKLADVVDEPIKKAITFGTKGKGTVAGRQQFSQKARSAVSDIVENKDKLGLFDELGESKLPESVDDFALAINQTKKEVYSEIDDILKKTKLSGVEADTTKLVDDLIVMGNDKNLQAVNPEAANYALKQAQAISNLGSIGIDDAESQIQRYNEILKAFQQAPQAQEVTKRAVDNQILKGLRESLDNAVEKTTGDAIKPLKQRYGALKEIEEQVNKKAFRLEGARGSGLSDLFDARNMGELARGLTAKDAGSVALAAVTQAIKEASIARKRPDNIIKRMFKNAEKVIQGDTTSIRGEAALAGTLPATARLGGTGTREER